MKITRTDTGSRSRAKPGSGGTQKPSEVVREEFALSRGIESENQGAGADTWVTFLYMNKDVKKK